MKVINNNKIKTVYDEELTITLTKREFMNLLAAVGSTASSDVKRFMKNHNISDKSVEMNLYTFYKQMEKIVKTYINSDYILKIFNEEEEGEMF